MWNQEQLRWYQRVPDYDLAHWWTKPGAPQAGEGTVKIDHPLLARVGRSGRPEIMVEPVLWEILRRHPELPRISGKFYYFWGLYRHALTFNELMIFEKGFLSQWNDRGRELMALLILKGNEPWPQVAATLRVERRDPFGDFLASKLNFPSGKRIRGRPWVAAPMGNTPFSSPENHTVKELRQSAQHRGKSLLVVEFDEYASPEQVGEGVKEFLMADRKSSLEPYKPLPGASQARFIHMNQRKLELLELLDSRDKALNGNSLKSILQIFSEIRIAAVK